MPLPTSGPPITAPGYAGLLLWLQREMSPVYRTIKDKAPHIINQGMSGLADNGVTTYFGPADGSAYDATAAPSPVSAAAPAADPNLPGGQPGGIADTIARLALPVITGVEQIKLFNTQLSLAQQGKPPLNASQISLPSIGVHFAVPGGATPWLIGGGLLGLWVLFGRGRARR